MQRNSSRKVQHPQDVDIEAPEAGASENPQGKSSSVSKTKSFDSNGRWDSALSRSTTSTRATEDSAKLRKAQSSRSASVLMGRGIFVCCLILVAVALALLAYYYIADGEQRLVSSQYFSMTERALDVTRSLATNKLQHGTMVMAQVASHSFPNASSWPYVWIEGYWDIVGNVLPTSCYTGIHLAPIVQPEQSEQFENFAYGKFVETFGENTTMGAYSHFGKGIWGKWRAR